MGITESIALAALALTGGVTAASGVNNAAFIDYNGTTASNTTSLSPSFITGSPCLYALNNNGIAEAFSTMALQIFTRGAGLTTAQSATLRSLNNAYIAAISAI